MKNDCYKFIGVINFFGVCPDFVYPIFENDGKYYFQKTNYTIITSFSEIKDTLHINMINFLDEDITMFINIKNQYYVGEEAIVAFQANSNKFFVSNTSSFVSFISKFTTDDHILREEIDTFLDSVKRRKLINNNKRSN